MSVPDIIMIKIVNNDSKRGRYRWWMFTWNNPCEHDVTTCSCWKQKCDSFKAKYLLAQLEKGENGTYHIQGVLYLPTEVSSSHFKGIPIWTRGIAKKDVENVLRYCSKLETRQAGPYEYGERPHGYRSENKYVDALVAAKEGRFNDIEADIYIKHFGNLKKINAEAQQPRETSGTRGLWIYGPPGTGKTHYARSLSTSLFLKSQNKWWDGYTGQEYVLLDDFDRSGVCLGHYLKIWADKWPCYGEIKGATIPLNHVCFIITSNYSPTEFWSDDEQMLKAIVRRFKFLFMPDRDNIISIDQSKFLINTSYSMQVYNQFVK